MNEMQAQRPSPLGHPSACAMRRCHPTPHPLRAGLARLRGLAPADATPCIKAKASPQSVHRNISQGAMQPLPESSGSGGGPPPPENHDPPNDDGGGDSNTSRFMAAISAQGPALIVALAVIAVGTFHRYVFAMPAMQRDITELKSGQAELLSEMQRSHAELKSEMQCSHVELKSELQRSHAELKSELQRSHAEIKSGQAELKSELQRSHAELKLMVQRLCVAMGKPECAFPPGACA